MAINSWPFEEQEVTETQFSQWADALAGRSGVVGEDDFKVTAGSGFTLSSAAGLAIVRGHAVYDSEADDVVIPAADSQARIDLVVLELDPSETPPSTIVRKVISGTPAASPVAPTLTQTVGDVYQFPIAQVAVGADAVNIVSANITDLRVKVLGVAWSEISGKPSTFAPSTHTHPASQVSDSTSTGRSVLTAASVTAAREALRFFEGDGPAEPQAGDIRFRDAT